MTVIKKQSLYQIEQEYRQLEIDLFEAEGELTPELEKRLNISEESLVAKSAGYVHIIKEKESLLKSIKEEGKRLKALKSKVEKDLETFKGRIKHAMELFELEEIKLPLNRINFRNSKSVAITVEPSDLQKDCQKIEIKAISKTELKERLNAGEKIPGVELVTNRNLQIK